MNNFSAREARFEPGSLTTTFSCPLSGALAGVKSVVEQDFKFCGDHIKTGFVQLLEAGPVMRFENQRELQDTVQLLEDSQKHFEQRENPSKPLIYESSPANRVPKNSLDNLIRFVFTTTPADFWDDGEPHILGPKPDAKYAPIPMPPWED